VNALVSHPWLDLCAELDAIGGEVRAGFSELSGRLARLDVSLGSLVSQMIQINILTGSLHYRTGRIGNRMERLERRIAWLDERTARIEHKLGMVDA
jgi:hypothetical protein